jgi:hypothetical protein
MHICAFNLHIFKFCINRTMSKIWGSLPNNEGRTDGRLCKTKAFESNIMCRMVPLQETNCESKNYDKNVGGVTKILARNVCIKQCVQCVNRLELLPLWTVHYEDHHTTKLILFLIRECYKSQNHSHLHPSCLFTMMFHKCQHLQNPALNYNESTLLQKT